MQVNDLVKVLAKDDNEGRAGVVVQSSEGVNEVRLDASGTHDSELGQYHDNELQLLGR